MLLPGVGGRDVMFPWRLSFSPYGGSFWNVAAAAAAATAAAAAGPALPLPES